MMRVTSLLKKLHRIFLIIKNHQTVLMQIINVLYHLPLIKMSIGKNATDIPNESLLKFKL